MSFLTKYENKNFDAHLCEKRNVKRITRAAIKAQQMLTEKTIYEKFCVND